MIMGIIGAGLSAGGSGMQAYGESRGASGSIGAINRQIAEQKRLQAESDAEMMARLEREQAAREMAGNSSVRASRMASGGGSMQNLFAENDVSNVDNAINMQQYNTALANRNLEIRKQQANRLAELYGAETNVGGMQGIGQRSFGQGMRMAGRALMQAQMMKGFGGAGGAKGNTSTLGKFGSQNNGGFMQKMNNNPYLKNTKYLDMLNQNNNDNSQQA